VQDYVLWYQYLGMDDVDRVGGKNASLGEMISNLANAGVQVPGGFATTASAFHQFLEQSGLEARIHDILDTLDVDDVNALAALLLPLRTCLMRHLLDSKRPFLM
jgi:pyruvate,water dikinase